MNRYMPLTWLKMLETSIFLNHRQIARLNPPRGRQSSTNPPPTSSNTDLEEIDNLIKARNKDMPMPDMTNPYQKERKQCILCKHNIKVDYKNTKLLSQFVSQFTGKVYHKRITGLCEEQQKRVERAAKLSRSAGYMPYMYKDLDFLEDPKLFDLRKK